MRTPGHRFADVHGTATVQGTGLSGLVYKQQPCLDSGDDKRRP